MRSALEDKQSPSLILWHLPVKYDLNQSSAFPVTPNQSSSYFSVHVSAPYQDVPSEAKPYFDFRQELSIIDDVMHKGQRIVIPQNMRKEALLVLHTAHQGIVQSKQMARDLMYRPGIGSQIEDTVSRCATCQK